MDVNKTNVAQVFAHNLQTQRKKAGLTQRQLSERLEISQKHLSFIETGVQFASASLIDRICEELNISCGVLFSSEKDVNIREVNIIGTLILNLISPKLAALENKIDELSKKIEKNSKPESEDIFL